MHCLFPLQYFIFCRIYHKHSNQAKSNNNTQNTTDQHSTQQSPSIHRTPPEHHFPHPHPHHFPFPFPLLPLYSTFQGRSSSFILGSRIQNKTTAGQQPSTPRSTRPIKMNLPKSSLISLYLFVPSPYHCKAEICTIQLPGKPATPKSRGNFQSEEQHRKNQSCPTTTSTTIPHPPQPLQLLHPL